MKTIHRSDAYLNKEGTPTDGVSLIAAERQRQISAEGWSAEHDDKHEDAELSQAAACYAIFPATNVPWPWDEGWDKRHKHGRIRRLVIAGALIAAEIDRVQRLRRVTPSVAS